MRTILANKSVPHEVERPLVHWVICYMLGIIGGNILLSEQDVSLFFLLLGFGIGLAIYSVYYNVKKALQCMGGVLLGFILFLNLPLHEEKDYFFPNRTYQIQGKIDQVKTTNYYKWLTLKDVTEVTTQRKLKSRVQVRVPLSNDVSIYDKIEANVTYTEIEPQMNPSDFNYEFYLSGQQIAATFKTQNLIGYEEKTPWIEWLQDTIRGQLEKLFSNEKIGIMEALILGDDTRLNPETEALYQTIGISHILCVSGSNVAVIIAGFMVLCSLLPLSYSIRQILLIVGIGGYALLTGCSTSIVRAALMGSIGLLGKYLWQEDDGITNVAIAAFIILIFNPYQLFMVGFQLSFLAVIGVILCSSEIEKKELYVEWQYTSWQRMILVWNAVQLVTWPVLAYHFFEIPFVGSLFNLIVIPVFSIIVIVGWWLLLLSFMPIPIAHIGSWAIEVILDGINKAVTWIVGLPLASLCTGRPNFVAYVLYFGGVILLWATIWGYCKKIRLYQGLVVIGCCYSMSLFMKPKILKITSLYVGQGDCSVIEMPNYGIFIIDGGNFGNGEVIESYVKYLGYDKIQGIMISHSDSDHIGGLLEILEGPMEVRQVFISESDATENLKTLELQCQKDDISIYELSRGEEIKYGKLQIECIAPAEKHVKLDNNENSIVCQLIYNRFSALFTGDQSKEIVERFYKEETPISLLKVSHHGSRTGTSRDLLLKLQPKYAMISCGIDNRYGHPHQEVLALLEGAKIEISRTDKEGAICYETDGKYIKKTSYRKDA